MWLVIKELQKCLVLFTTVNFSCEYSLCFVWSDQSCNWYFDTVYVSLLRVPPRTQILSCSLCAAGLHVCRVSHHALCITM